MARKIEHGEDGYERLLTVEIMVKPQSTETVIQSHLNPEYDLGELSYCQLALSLAAYCGRLLRETRNIASDEVAKQIDEMISDADNIQVVPLARSGDDPLQRRNDP